jgi:hypothetical protein
MTDRKPPEPRICEVHHRNFPVGWPGCVLCDLEPKRLPQPLDFRQRGET